MKTDVMPTNSNTNYLRIKYDRIASESLNINCRHELSDICRLPSSLQYIQGV